MRYTAKVTLELVCAEERARFERDLVRVLAKFGAVADEQLAARATRAVDQLLDALSASATDGGSLTPLDVVRVRANKFAAAQLPAAVFRDLHKLAALRAEILQLARGLLPSHVARSHLQRDEP